MEQKRLRILLVLMGMAALLLVGSVGAQGDDTPADPVVSAAGNPDIPALFPFPQDFVEQVASADRNGNRDYTAYRRIIDDLEMLSVDVPVEWSDIDMGYWTYRGDEVGIFIAAAADLDRFYNKRKEPGVFVGAIRASSDLILDLEQGSFSKKCKKKGRYVYKDMFYSGQYDLYVDCEKKGGHHYIVVVAVPASQEYIFLIRVGVDKKRDLQAATRIYETFQLIGDTQRLVDWNMPVITESVLWLEDPLTVK